MSFKFVSEKFEFHFSVDGTRYEVILERESLLENWFVTVRKTDTNEVLKNALGQKTLTGTRQTAEAILREVLELPAA